MTASATSADAYIQAMNAVLVVNYFGELLAAEMLSRLLARPAGLRYRQLLDRQLLDETRHANLTRRLLRDRGRDPWRDDSRAEFTFHDLFVEFAGRGTEALLVMMAENESLSAGNFSDLVRLGRRQGDEVLAALYAEIVNDEVRHCTSISAALPKDPQVAAVREEARARLHACVNRSYAVLFARFGDRPAGAPA